MYIIDNHKPKTKLVMKVYILLFIVLIGIISCSKDDNKRRIGTVQISEVLFPSDIEAEEDFTITVIAEANNGCWSNLFVKLDTIDNKHFKLSAFGAFSGSSVCPDVMVYADTTFYLKFREGEYYFQTFKTANTIQYDTLYVK